MVEDGLIGEVHYVRAFWYRNFDPTSGSGDRRARRVALHHPAGRQPGEHGLEAIPRDRRAQEHPVRQEPLFPVAQLLGLFGRHLDRPAGAPDRYQQLRRRQDRAELLRGFGRHLQWTKAGFKDDREVPDTLSALYEYPDRFHLNYSCFFGNDQYGYGEQFMGHKGTIEVMDRQNLHFYSQPKFIRGAEAVLEADHARSI